MTVGESGAVCRDAEFFEEQGLVVGAAGDAGRSGVTKGRRGGALGIALDRANVA
ncbi:hypothetical protein [Streptomyces sp. NPDC004685]